MALLFTLDPTPTAGVDVSTEAGTEATFRRDWMSQMPAKNRVPEAYYPNNNWRFRIADSSVITPREGSYSFYTRVLSSWSNYHWGAKPWDRLTMQLNTRDQWHHDMDRWHGWSMQIGNLGPHPASHGFHTVCDPHTKQGAQGAGGVGSLWSMRMMEGGRLKVVVRGKGGPFVGSTSDSTYNDWVYDQPNVWVTGQWMDFVTFTAPRTTQTGKFKLWFRIPGQSLVWQQLINLENHWVGFSDGHGDDPFTWQQDTYRSTSHPKWSRYCAWGPTRIGDETSSFAEVEPGQTGGAPAQVAVPVINPAGGTFTATQNPTLTSSTTGATIRYTLDGTAPSRTNGIERANGGTATVSASATLKVMGYKDGELDSGIESVQFTINEAVETGTVRINSGGPEVTDDNSNVWEADSAGAYYNGGSAFSVPNSFAGVPAADQDLWRYRRARAGGIEYGIPITSGKYIVRLGFGESVTSASFTGGRVSNVTIEGATVDATQDIWAMVGQNSPLTRQFAVDVADSVLNVSVANVTNTPVLQSIEAIPISSGVGSGVVRIEPAQASMSTTGGATVDLVASSLNGATVKGAFLWATSATANGTSTADGWLGMGILDGSSQFAYAVATEDGAASGASARNRANNSRCLILINVVPNQVEAELSFNSFITNGVRLNTDVAPSSAHKINAILFAGDDVEAHVATASADTDATGTDITSAGFEPTDLVAISTITANNDASEADAGWGLGFATWRSSTITQMHYAHIDQTFQYNSAAKAKLVTNLLGSEVTTSGSGLRYTWTASDFDADGVTVTPDNDAGTVNGATLALLMLRLNNVESKLQTVIAPSSADATHAETGTGFTPQSVMQIMTGLLSADTFKADNEASSSSISAFTANDEYAGGYTSDDNVATWATDSIVANKAAHMLANDGTSNELVATLVSMDSDGHTLDYTTANALNYGIAWSVESPATAKVPDLAIDPATGSFTIASLDVAITSAEPGVTIHYTTDGSTPTTGDTTYSVPFAITETKTVKALGVKSGYTDSDIATEVFTLQDRVQTPDIFRVTKDNSYEPISGTYGGPRSVHMETLSTGADVRYTLDGSTPTGSSTLYTQPFTISSTKTIKAIGIQSGYTDSDVASVVMTIATTLDAPTISVGTTPQRSPVIIDVETESESAAIWYTTDGTTPTEGGGTSTLMGADVTNHDDIVLKAIAILDGFTDSAVTSATIEMKLHRVHRRRLRNRGF